MKYRKEDLGKAIGLSALILIAFGFSFHTIRSAQRPRVAPKPKTGATTAGAEETKTAEMFAARSMATTTLVKKAQASPDPFRPGVVSGGPGARPRVVFAAVPSGTPHFAAQSPGAPAQPGFRVFGIVTGNRPVAAIQYQEKRYFVGVGDALPEGWQVARVAANGVALAKGKKQLALRLAEPERQGVQPLGVR